MNSRKRGNATVKCCGLFVWVTVMALTSPLPATAQPGARAAVFTTEQLEQLAAPIALYPDPLLAQLLMASTYPLEVVQAARFVKDNPGLKGDQLNAKLKEQSWDDSVKSLVEFPDVLTLMDQKLDWIQKLGDAFLGQQKELLDAVQRLRARAHAEGNLESTPQQTVTVEPAAPAAAPPPASGPSSQSPTVVVQQPPPTVITIQPTNPQVVYVPSYNPTVVYGAWPYPAAPPYYPYPPGYVFGIAALSFGMGMAVGAAVWGNCDWNNGSADVNVNNYNSYSNSVNRSDIANERVSHYQQGQGGNRQQGQGGNRAEWKHNPENRRGVQYRDQATQQRYNRGATASQQGIQSREAFRGRAEQGRQDLSRGGAGSFGGSTQGGRGAQGFGGAQGGARGPALGGGAPQRSFGGGGAGAFQGIGSGGQVRNFSNRGQSSRQSIGAGGGRSSGAGVGGGRSGGGGGGRSGGGGRGGSGGRR